MVELNCDLESENLTDGNKILGSVPKLINTKINFLGKNNILYCDKNVEIINSTLNFNCDNSLIFLNKGLYYLNAAIHFDSVLYIGENNYFNPGGNPISIIVSEHKNVFIGNGNLFSTNISIRNADSHLVYNSKTKKRINPSKSCYIGDKVWIGQNAVILKGSMIYSNCIIGANSVVPNKNLKSGRIYAGNPIKQIKKNICRQGKCVHKWDKNMTAENEYISDDSIIYKYSKKDFISFDIVEKNLDNFSLAFDKCNYLKNLSKNINRFTR